MRYAVAGVEWGWLMLGLGLLVWSPLLPKRWKHRGVPIGLWLASGGAAAVYYYQYREVYASDDISSFASETAQLRRLRGWLLEEPTYHPPPVEPLQHVRPQASTTLVLVVTSIETAVGWQPASGRIRVLVEGDLPALHAGDQVELYGQLSLPPRPDNPGQMDLRAWYRDSRITAVLRVRSAPAAVVRWHSSSDWTDWQRLLARLRRNGETVLRQHLGEQTAGLASALLLGQTAALDQAQWEVYIRTGVVHVLAISGFHLTVLATVVWLLGRLMGTSSQVLAAGVVVVVVLYTCLTGARAPAVRAAVMVGAACLALCTRRPLWSAHSLALAWLIVVLLRPTEPFTIGCQLSFLSVFVLLWAGNRWQAPLAGTPQNPQWSQIPVPLGRRGLMWLLRQIVAAYWLSLVMFVALAPLVLYWKNIIAPISVLLGPPVTLTSSIALVSGLVTLLLGPLGSWACAGPAAMTDATLMITAQLVQAVDAWNIGTVYAPAPPLLWLIGFYSLLLATILAPTRWVPRGLAAVVVWTLLGCIVSWTPRTSDELRVTFVAVGHGGCVVVETPDGRTLLYDVGSMTGPQQIPRIVAPYLWHRGIRHIDELFLSHADLDHFNGLLELLQRFPIGQISWTPTFAQRPTPEVQRILAAIQQRHIPTRTVAAGDRWSAGEVHLQVLHPPQHGPPGPENVRSLVLLLHYAGQHILLTGDLEGLGQQQLVRLPVPPVAVLMAPHHGGQAANTPGAVITPDGAAPCLLAAWARPRLVVSCQRAVPTSHLLAAYPHAVVWDTASRGAIVIRVHSSGVVAEAFRTNEKWVVARSNSSSSSANRRLPR
jgi:competence protein ComEC